MLVSNLTLPESEFHTCTCSVDVWVDIICIDVNGLRFVLQDWNVYGGWYFTECRLFVDAPKSELLMVFL